MKRGTRALVYCANVVTVTSVVFGLAHCSGGERPRTEDDPVVDAARQDAATTPIDIVGYVEDKGLVFGDDGFVNCGGQAPARELTFKNTNRDVVRFTAKMLSGADYYTINPAEGGIPANGTAQLQITPKPIPQSSDVTKDLFAGTLELEFSNGEVAEVIRLHQTARGAIITSTLAGNGEFGEVRVEKEGSFPYTISNSGNLPVTANLALGSTQFTLDGAQLATIPLDPSATATRAVKLKPTKEDVYGDTLSVSFNQSAVHCKTPPANIALKGKGTSSIAVSPGAMDFGSVGCGRMGTSQIVTIETASATDFTPVLIAGQASPYTLVNDKTNAAVQSGVAITLAAAEVYKLRVTPKQVPVAAPTGLNGFGDTLRIDIPNATSRNIVLNQTAQGAVFTLSPVSINAQDNVPNRQLSHEITIGNTGNMTGEFELSLEDNGPGLSINVGSGAIGAGQVFKAALKTITPGPGQASSGKIFLLKGTNDTTGQPVVTCGTLPGAMDVSITNPQ